jgi:hypothetical protein
VSQRRGAGYRPGGGGAGGPAGNAGARGALLLAVAVILGIVLLQQFDSGIDTGGQVATNTSTPDGTSTTRRVGLTTAPAVTSTTAALRPKADVKVLVANGSGLRGLAGTTSNALKGLGWATLAPTDATGAVDKTTVQFADGYEAEAREVAANLTLPATVVVRATSPPVAAADIGDAKVVVVLGTDVTSSTSSTAAGATTTSTTIRR